MGANFIWLIADDEVRSLRLLVNSTNHGNTSDGTAHTVIGREWKYANINPHKSNKAIVISEGFDF